MFLLSLILFLPDNKANDESNNASYSGAQDTYGDIFAQGRCHYGDRYGYAYGEQDNVMMEF
ncbi:MAG: hypothetical protein IJK78_02195 [Bacteroidales bacterium]|nr:hypothetical protein [Bacteroidales bacterium]